MEFVSNNESEYVTVKKAGKTGKLRLDGKVIVPLKYDRANQLGKDYFKVTKNEKEGIINKDGKEILPPKYRDLHLTNTDDGSVSFTARSNSNQVLLINEKGEEKVYGISYSKYAYGGHLSEGRYFYYNNKIVDLKEKVYLFCGEALKKNKIKKHPNVKGLYYIDSYQKNYFFNIEGGILPELTGNKDLKYQNDRAIVRVNTDEKDQRGRFIPSFGMKDEQLTWVVQPEYAAIILFQSTDLYLAVKKDKSAGVINNAGETVIPFNYSLVVRKGEEYLAYAQDNPDNFDVLNEKGEKLYSGTGRFKSINYDSHYKTAYRQSDHKRVILNNKFQEIYDGKFNNIGLFNEGAIWLETFTDNGKAYSLIDLEGKPYALKIDGKPRNDFKKVSRVVRTPFFHIQFSNGDNYIYNSGTKKAYAINSEINHVGRSFYKSMGLLEIGKEYRKDKGIMDTLGREIIPPLFGTMSRVSGYSGAAFYTYNGEQSQVFTIAGKELFAEYEGAKYLFNHYFAVKKNDKWGVLTLQNKQILPCEYLKIAQYGGSKFSVEDAAGEKSYRDLQGRVME